MKPIPRTVYTFVGTPEAVVEGALAAARVAAAMIDMSSHHGEHPRMGALDVCPFIPVKVNIPYLSYIYMKMLNAYIFQWGLYRDYSTKYQFRESPWTIASCARTDSLEDLLMN